MKSIVKTWSPKARRFLKIASIVCYRTNKIQIKQIDFPLVTSNKYSKIVNVDRRWCGASRNGKEGRVPLFHKN